MTARWFVSVAGVVASSQGAQPHTVRQGGAGGKAPCIFFLVLFLLPAASRLYLFIRARENRFSGQDGLPSVAVA